MFGWPHALVPLGVTIDQAESMVTTFYISLLIGIVVVLLRAFSKYHLREQAIPPMSEFSRVRPSMLASILAYRQSFFFYMSFFFYILLRVGVFLVVAIGLPLVMLQIDLESLKTINDILFSVTVQVWFLVTEPYWPALWGLATAGVLDHIPSRKRLAPALQRFALIMAFVVRGALAWPFRAAARVRVPAAVGRWGRRFASAVAAAGVAVGLMVLAEPLFQPSPEPAIVADVVVSDGVERRALIEGRAQVRIVEDGARFGVVRGHGAAIVAASFVEGGAALETRDAHGEVRRTNLASLPWLSWPEREHLAAGGYGARAWSTAGAPTLAALRSGWRWAECASGLGPWCPLTVFRDTLVDGSLGPEMVVIPAGSFLMGSPEDEEGRFEVEGPQRTVDVPRFALARMEVTVGAYRQFVEATGHDGGNNCATLSGGDSWRQPGFEQTDDDPVVCVSWQDAQAYIAWLNRRTPGAPYRLPTEAEWAYATRAGSQTRYPFGDNDAPLADHAWFSANSETRTQPVATRRPNAFRLYDTLGNAWEWTEDCWHPSYENAPRDASAWLAAGNGDCSRAVLRGGSWGLDAPDLRSALRSWGRRDIRVNDVGFRLARTLPGA